MDSRLVLSLFALCAVCLIGLNANAESNVAETSPGFEILKKLSDPERRVRPAKGKYNGPIIDTHVHLLKDLKHSSIRAISKKMIKSGVVRMIVLPTPNEGRYRDRADNATNRRNIVRSDGKRFQRLCGSTYLTHWMHRAYHEEFDKSELTGKLNRLKQDLESGGCIGIGEIGPYHFLKKPGQTIIEYPLTFEPMLKVVEFAARKGVWLDLHVEPIDHNGRSYEDEIFGAIAHWYRKYPSLNLILSHTGMTNAHNARELLRLYPNLMMNWKHVPYGISLNWDNLERIHDRNDCLYEDWAQLFEEMPERFMVGTDARFGIKRFSGKRYSKILKAIRKVLSCIDPTAAEMIGYKNAERVFGRL